ncbi:MAG: ABC transporter ATP-binding protein [Zestosphaera tikiterensis]|uniref:ABC transporter ATP-binding protein n=1 Tax=Zestosphaera tikiterensis TaxID=1973259 RepID=A0A2R7Y9S7_9CREN|nr:MAG: ABC transporter ATP-binding protein [Zestosphaera tikiterensis]
MVSNVKAVVELVDVWKMYKVGDIITWGLRGVDLKVFKGDFIAIMGPSGSGKTTLLNIMGLLDKPTKGKVFIDGIEASKLSSRDLAIVRNRKIGFVFQQFNLISRLTIYENLELPLIPSGLNAKERRERIVSTLKSVGGDEAWLRKKPTQLSGGQQQRVAIARALVNNPSLILADEPTGNLDRASAKTVIQTFMNLNAKGQTIVIVTHDPEVANCTNKIYVIRDGKIVSVEEPDKDRCLALRA